MKDRVRNFKNGKIHPDELLKFKEDIDLMSDEELDECLNGCEPDFTFSKSDIDALQHRLNDDVRTERRRELYHRFYKVCAAVMFPALLVCCYLLFNSYQDLDRFETMVAQVIDIETDNGESSTTTLPDGSKIFMGPKSVLTYSLASFNSASRDVRYSGEGRFSIAKKDGVPFILQLPDFEVKVLGTTFSLYTRENRQSSEIYLEEGSLQISSHLSDSKKLLRPGETAVIDNETGSIEIIDDETNRKISAGRSVIYFKSSALAEVAREMELYYGKNVDVDASLAAIQFTGSLPTRNFSQAIYVLENSLGVAITVDEEHNTLRLHPIK